MLQGYIPKRRVCEIFQSMGNVQKRNGKTSEACDNTYTHTHNS
jgi:hypothetical protein